MITVLRNTSMTLWQVMNRGFRCMSPKVNSSRLYGCLKMSQIQQKLLAHEVLPSKWLPVFTEKWNISQSYHYTTICLPVAFQEIRKTNRGRRIALHHDNASSHISAQTTALLSTENIDLMSHPLYSFDLASNDFFLFPYVQNKMRGQGFSKPEEAIDVFRMHVLETP